MKLLFKEIIILTTVLLLSMFAVIPSAAFVLNGYHVPMTITYEPYSGFDLTSRTNMGLAAEEWNNEVYYFTMLDVASSTHSDETGFYTRDYHKEYTEFPTQTDILPRMHIGLHQIQQLVNLI